MDTNKMLYAKQKQMKLLHKEDKNMESNQADEFSPHSWLESSSLKTDEASSTVLQLRCL